MTKTSRPTDVFSQNPFFALSTKILNIYAEAIRQNMEAMSISSVKIIQEQTIKAWSDAMQSCSKALAENAMSRQQPAIDRIADANRETFRVVLGDLSPFKIQPMAGVANWFPGMPDYRSMTKSKSASNK